MSAARRGSSWAVAAGIAAVEALKDQGFCRWNYTIRSLHHHARNRLKSVVQDAKRSTAVIPGRARRSEKIRESDESMRTVIFLSSWGPNN